MITAERITKIAPAAKPYVQDLIAQMRANGITGNVTRAAMFLAQIHVESGGFTRVVENLNYSDDALIAKFGRHRISVQDARKFGRNADHPAHQNAIANILYGGEFGREELGNTQPGDGWKFRGRGLKQLTGRDNYRRFSLWWLGSEKLLESPDLVAQAAGAVASAVWFWMANGLNRLADTGSVSAVTKVVNGGANGLDERKKWFMEYLKAFAI